MSAKACPTCGYSGPPSAGMSWVPRASDPLTKRCQDCGTITWLECKEAVLIRDGKATCLGGHHNDTINRFEG